MKRRGENRGRCRHPCSDVSAERVEQAFADLEGEADVVLLAGDLTTSGEPVYNVAVHVTERNFWIVELDGSGERRGGEVVEVREPPE